VCVFWPKIAFLCKCHTVNDFVTTLLVVCLAGNKKKKQPSPNRAKRFVSAGQNLAGDQQLGQS